MKATLQSVFIAQIDRELDDDEWTKNFRDIGVDSLDKVAIIMAVEQACDLTIPDQAMMDMNTAQDLLDYLVNATARG